MNPQVSCVMCKIVDKIIPCHKLAETKNVVAFMDISPLSKGHLIVPKYHAQFLHEVPDESLTEILPLAKKIATAIGCPNYNILQNNGHLAHQAVDHVHFHIIPKPDNDSGLKITWTPYGDNPSDLPLNAKEILEKL